jgi:hypothetical protein
MKKIALIAALLSTQVFAGGSTTTHTDPVTYGAQNRYTEIFTGHAYTVTNDSATSQNLQVCYTTTACAEYPANTQRVFSCDNVTLGIGQTKSGNFIQDLKAIYKFHGWCNVNAATEIKGWIYQISRSDGNLSITN